MIYTSMSNTDSYYEFSGSEGKLIMPATEVILTDDESGMIAIKNTASRCTIGLLKKGSTPPTPPAFQGKWLATYTGGTQSAECDASSAITQNEIALTDLVSVEIGDCVTSIGDNAFIICSSLTSCTIGSGVTSIGYRAFAGCSGLTSIDIPDSVTSIGMSAFMNCSGLTTCTIGNGVASIGMMAFQSCTSLTSIDIPSGVTRIDSSAFTYCTSLTSIDIPSGVTRIESRAFSGCSSLTSITVNATTPPTLGSGVFNNTNNCPIYVPRGSVDTYKAASGWNSYTSRLQEKE